MCQLPSTSSLQLAAIRDIANIEPARMVLFRRLKVHAVRTQHCIVMKSCHSDCWVRLQAAYYHYDR
jgi:hypothetical protein